MSLPPSSPRLPSPPPAAEIQITPNSPLMGPNSTRQAAQIEQTAIDTNAKRRIHPGTKSADMAAGPPLVPLHELDSAFQLQEHLAALHYHHTGSKTTPVNRDTAKLLAAPPPGTDKTLWLYELCRFLIAQCNSLIIGFLFDTPPCSAATCPEMRAGEWQFLCAVHDTPKSCCAIDYCCHTLDWAANVVTNPKIFPSRFVVDAHDKNTALKNLVNVFRRLHRIFAHAWFQHRGVFWSLESQSGLYVFFKTVCDVYDLLPAENYKLPPEAEGLDSSSGAGDIADRGVERRQQQQHPLGPISIAKPPSQRDGEDGDFSGMSRTNTRRHIKSSPSVGSAVTTVPEADEDDSSDLTNRLRGMRISSARGAPDDERDVASVPVIVEHRPVTALEQPVRPSSVVPPSETTANPSLSNPEHEPGPAKQEAEAPEREHEFASEPEPPAQTEAKSEPEPTQETQPKSKAVAEETPSVSVAEVEQHQPSEQSTATEEPAAGAEEADAESGPQEPSSTTAVDEASGKEAPSSPVAAAEEAATADETETDSKAEDKADESTEEPASHQKPEPGPEEAQGASTAGEGGEKEEGKEKDAETKPEVEPKTEGEAEAEPAKAVPDVASPTEKGTAEECDKKEEEKEADVEMNEKEEENGTQEKRAEEDAKEMSEGDAKDKSEAETKEGEQNQEAEEGKKAASDKPEHD